MVFIAAPIARSQTTITTITLGPDQIGIVRTAQGLSTRISFPEPVREIICGDLYDPASGKGTFIAQRSDNDVFLKPVSPKGQSNLFVKTGEKGDHVYNFDLMIVPLNQAFRVVNVNSLFDRPRSNPVAPSSDQPSKAPNESDAQPPKPTIEQQQQQAEEALRNARQKAARIIAEAEQRAVDIERQAAQRIDQEVENRFIRALMLGIKDTKLNNTKATLKKVSLTLDPKMITVGEKSYLRFTFQNYSDAIFIFNSVTLETISGDKVLSIPVEITKNKTENWVVPGETLSGVISFNNKEIEPAMKFTIYIRAEDNSPLMRLTVN